MNSAAVNIHMYCIYMYINLQYMSTGCVRAYNIFKRKYLDVFWNGYTSVYSQQWLMIEHVSPYSQPHILLSDFNLCNLIITQWYFTVVFNLYFPVNWRSWTPVYFGCLGFLFCKRPVQCSSLLSIFLLCSLINSICRSILYILDTIPLAYIY